MANVAEPQCIVVVLRATDGTSDYDFELRRPINNELARIIHIGTTIDAEIRLPRPPYERLGRQVARISIQTNDAVWIYHGSSCQLDGTTTQSSRLDFGKHMLNMEGYQFQLEIYCPPLSTD